MPKSAHGNDSKHLFYNHFLNILFFYIPSVERIIFAKVTKNRLFHNVSDALAGPNMGHQKKCRKLKNDRHAAWERSGRKKNERHAAWQRFRNFHGPDGSPKRGPPTTPQTIYFKLFGTFCGTYVKSTGAEWRNCKTSATLHGSAFLQASAKQPAHRGLQKVSQTVCF